jgi:cytoskeletal protein RodZ
MNSVGQELKKERELRGVSLKEIADTTKINMRYLRALEEDNFDMLPGNFFIKSIIKAYAGYIGLDEDVILDHFHHTIQTKKEEIEEQPREETAPTEVPRKFKLFLRIAGYSIILITAFFIIFFLVKGKNSVSISESTSTTELLFQSKFSDLILNSINPSDGMILEMTFHQETWIEIFTDGKLYYSGLKHPGEQLFSTAENEFLIHLGNAGGFTYSINGVPGEPLGKPWQVIKNLRITTKNYKQYFIKGNETRPTNIS